MCVSLPHLRPPSVGRSQPPLTPPHLAPPLLQTDFRAAVPHSAQQGAVKSFSAFRSASSLAGRCACVLPSFRVCVWRVEYGCCCSWHTVALILQVLPLPGGRGKKEVFSVPGSSGPEGQHAQPRRKLIGYTFLVCLCLLDLLLSSLPSLRVFLRV